MPRIKSAANLAKSAVSQSSLLNTIKVNPSHITLFCSQTQGQTLLEALPDVKPIINIQKYPHLKAKINKAHLKLQASARQAFKLSLSSNQIRTQQKFTVINDQLFIKDESQDSKRQLSNCLKEVSQFYKNQKKMIQKLNKVISLFPINCIRSDSQINGNWILNDTQNAQQILSAPYSLLINPTIIYGSDISTQYEQCISFPFLDCMIPRYNKLLIHYYNQNYKSQFVYTSGFVSRVVQHQCQHLQGKNILDWRINHGNMQINSSVIEYFPKSYGVVEDYSKSLKNILKQFPDLIETREEYFIEQKKLQTLLTTILQQSDQLIKQQLSQQMRGNHIRSRSSSRSIEGQIYRRDNYNADFSINKKVFNDQLPFEDDFVVRLVKHFKKQFVKFDQKIQLGLINFDDINNKDKHIIINQNKDNKSSNKQNKCQIMYIEQQYSKLIKIKYLNSQQQLHKTSKSSKSVKQQHIIGQQRQISDQELLKLLKKHKKSIKKK